MNEPRESGLRFCLRANVIPGREANPESRDDMGAEPGQRDSGFALSRAPEWRSYRILPAPAHGKSGTAADVVA